MKRSTKIIYAKSFGLAVGITILLHFFTLLLIAGYNVFNSPFIVPYETIGFKRILLLYSFLSLFLFLFVEFVIVFKVQGNSRRYKAGWNTLAVLGTALLYGGIVIALYKGVLGLSNEMNLRLYIGSMIGNGFLSFVVLLISVMDFNQKKQRATDLENEMLKAQNIQSRYEALKNQIDPHFLFNTFSSLTSMIDLDPSRAQEFSIKMSSVLRYTLQNNDLVTLEEEIAFAKDYCELMHIRYDDNFTVYFDIDDRFKSFFVVPLCIQTLIENAVKHNEISNRSPLHITIYTNEDETVTVWNKINPKRNGSSGTGLGLTNLSERYKLKLQREIEIYSDSNTFRVTLPLTPPEKIRS